MVDASAGDEIESAPDAATLYDLITRIGRALRTRVPTGGLPTATAAALWTIINNGPIRLSTLAERESVTMATMSRIVAALEERGCIERTDDPEDGRARLLVATPAGIALVTKARAQKAQHLADAIDGLDDVDSATIARGLSLLAEALKAT